MPRTGYTTKDSVSFTPPTAMIRRLLPGLVLPLMLVALPARAQDSTDTAAHVKAARAAAMAWLALLDARDFDASWEAAASSFRQAVTAPGWRQALTNAYAAFDTLTTRTYMGGKYLTNIPNAPPGEYVVMQFSSTFGEAHAIETVTFIREGDAWKAAGYFVKPQ